MDRAGGFQMQNGAPPAAEGDVGQLINLDGYRVEVRQQTEHTSYSMEHVQQQPDGTEQVCIRTFLCPVYTADINATKHCN